MKRSIFFGAAACAAILALAISFGGCALKSDPIKLPYSGYAPLDRGDGMALSDPASEGMDPVLVERAFRLLHSPSLDDFPTALSLTVARNGRIVAESYCSDPADAGRRQCCWSVTKSFVSLMYGVAVQDGLLSEADLDRTFSSMMTTWPAGHPDKDGITVREAFHMSTGIAYFNDGDDSDDAAFFKGEPKGTLPYILSLPLESAPGAEYRYKNSDPQLVACLIAEKAGKSLARYADERLFSRLGITDYKWDGYRDGVTYGGFGLWLKPRDMLKVGEFVRLGGAWNGAQIVDPAWLAHGVSPRSRTPDGALYGYFWWVRPNFGGYSAWGHGGQYIYVIPSLALTIVFTAEPDAKDVGADELGNFEKIVNLIYRAAGGPDIP